MEARLLGREPESPALETQQFPNVEPSRFECGVLCGAPTEPQVRGGGPQATQANWRFISFLLAI